MDASSLPELTIGVAQSPSSREKCLSLRVTVFVEEQNVPMDLELDDYDKDATHYLVSIDENPVAVARLVDYLDNGRRVAKIGRVAVLSPYRKQGVGKALMQSILEDARARGFEEAMLDSQTYVISFYRSLGFIQEGEEFLDANIPHYRMRRRL